METLADKLKTISAGIKGVSINQRKDALVLRAVLPPKTGVGPGKQQWLPLGLKADEHGVKVAHQRALAVAAAKSAGTFDWNNLPWEPPPPPSLGQTGDRPSDITVADAVEQLEADFWQGRVRTSAAERTWQRLRAEVDRMPPAATLTMDLMVATANTTSPGTRTRQEFLKVSKRVAKLVGIDGTERLDALKTPYEPEVRDVPADETIAELVDSVADDPTWGWCLWALATFGCRPAEVFSLRPAGDGTAQVLTVKRKGKLPIWRTALALPVSQPQCDRMVPWDVGAPAKYDSATAKLHCDRWAGWLRRRHPTIQLYDLRHAWAIRSISKLPSTSIAAKCMGHDIAVHHRTYHRWIDQADIAAVAAGL